MHFTHTTLRRAAILVLAGALAATSACGPKDIGTGSSGASSAAGAGAGAPTAALRRYPMTGANARERMLYLHNRPDVMQQVQDWRLQSYQRRMGIEPSPEDPAYRATPKRRSPFRQ